MKIFGTKQNKVTMEDAKMQQSRLLLIFLVCSVKQHKRSSITTKDLDLLGVAPAVLWLQL